MDTSASLANQLSLFFIEMEDFMHKAHDRVIELYNRKLPAQRTAEWYKARTESITASDLANVFPMSREICEFYVNEFNLSESFTYSTKKGCNKYSTLRDLVIKKTEMGAEHRVRSEKKDNFPSDAIMHGQMFEPVSQMIYSQIKQEDILEVGLVKHPEISFLAASPDGIAVQSGTMLEIKCPSKRPVSNVPPLWYWIQMQAQMECCNLTMCDFFDCQFVKYLFADEWRKDADEWMKDNPDTKHHQYGILMEVDTMCSDKEYIYAPVDTVTPDQFEEWAAKQEEEDPSHKRVYYTLHKYHLTAVRKQPNWLEVTLPKIEEAWNTITYYRAKENAEKYQEFIAKKTRASNSNGSGANRFLQGTLSECLC